MANQELKAYIKSALEKGIHPNNIEKILIKEGWDTVEINRIILDLKMGKQASSTDQTENEIIKKEKPKKSPSKKMIINAIYISSFLMCSIFISCLYR